LYALRTIMVFLLLSTVALPQDSGARDSTSSGLESEDRAIIRQLVEQVKHLQAQVASLESKQALPEAVAASAPAQPTPFASGDTSGGDHSQAADFRETHDLHGIRWRGFGEVNYKAVDQKQSGLAAFGSVAGPLEISTPAISIYFSPQKSPIKPASSRKS